MTHEGPALGIKRVALLYATNDFTTTQANAVRDFFKKSGAPLDIVYDQGVKFKFLFSIYRGLETAHLFKTAGTLAMKDVTTYVTSSDINYKPEIGLNLEQYKKAWQAANAGSKIEFGFNAVAGYTTGLIVESALRITDSMEQLALRKAMGELSGKLTTIDGPFESWAKTCRPSGW